MNQQHHNSVKNTLSTKYKSIGINIHALTEQKVTILMQNGPFQNNIYYNIERWAFLIVFL